MSLVPPPQSPLSSMVSAAGLVPSTPASMHGNPDSFSPGTRAAAVAAAAAAVGGMQGGSMVAAGGSSMGTPGTGVAETLNGPASPPPTTPVSNFSKDGRLSSSSSSSANSSNGSSIDSPRQPSFEA